jgi:hypothetical protein
MRIRIMQALEAVFERLADWAENMRTRVAVCRHCGRNRYTGTPCVKLEER